MKTLLRSSFTPSTTTFTALLIPKWELIPTLTNPLSIARCPTIPFSSDTSSLQWASDSTSQGFSPTTPPPLQMPNTGSESPDYPQLLPKVAIYGQSPWPPPWTSSFAAATAAKSLQLCPTLCDPRDGSPPGSATPGILQARTLEWVAISFSSAWKWKVKGKSLSRVRLLATPWTAAHQTSPSMGFSRQEYWSGVPLPSPNHLLAQLIKLRETCSSAYYILKDTIKGPARRDKRGQGWKGSECRNFCPCGTGVQNLPGLWIHSPTWKLITFYLGMFIEL